MNYGRLVTNSFVDYGVSISHHHNRKVCGWNKELVA